MISARFLLPVPDAPLVRRALGPEVRSSPGASLTLRGGVLELRLRASSAPGLRSQVNAWLRLVEVASTVAGAVPEATPRGLRPLPSHLAALVAPRTAQVHRPRARPPPRITEPSPPPAKDRQRPSPRITPLNLLRPGSAGREPTPA